MNYIRHLSGFFIRLAEDQRMTPYHISLYFALFQQWNAERFVDQFAISRSEMMQLSRIGSVNTYARCMKELEQWGYIRYAPSSNLHSGSRVACIRFDTATDTASDTGRNTASDTSTSSGIESDTGRNTGRVASTSSSTESDTATDTATDTGNSTGIENDTGTDTASDTGTFSSIESDTGKNTGRVASTSSSNESDITTDTGRDTGNSTGIENDTGTDTASDTGTFSGIESDTGRNTGRVASTSSSNESDITTDTGRDTGNSTGIENDTGTDTAGDTGTSSGIESDTGRNTASDTRELTGITAGIESDTACDTLLINSLNKNKQEEKSVRRNQKLDFDEKQKNKKRIRTTNSENLPDEKFPVPDLPEVEQFFEQNQFPRSEAQKFYTHYQSSGWKTGDQMKILSWQAVARKWMINTQSFKNDERESNQIGTSKHSVTVNKDYSEPL